MMYTLGIITGILLCAFLITVDIWLRRTIHKEGLHGILTKVTQERGVITTPPSDEVLNWQDRLKKNDRLGKDTPLEEF